MMMSDQVLADVSEIRAGKENDGPLESTDLYVSGRGVSLLCNVVAGHLFTYSLRVDKTPVQSGTVGGATDVADAPELHALRAERDMWRQAYEQQVSACRGSVHVAKAYWEEIFAVLGFKTDGCLLTAEIEQQLNRPRKADAS